MKTNLTIIIPTLSNIRGLKDLLNYFKDKSYKVVVVDNKKKNLGFAGGVNKGSENIRTKWMLILNDDVKFYDEVSINRLIEFAERKKLDAVSPILINQNGEAENYGYKLLPIGKIQLVKEDPRSKSQETNKSRILNTKYEILDTDIDGLTAACLLIRSEVFKKLKGFDESFFTYLEDVDFFIRFKKFGYKMTILKSVKVLHNHMTTSKMMGNFKARQDMINWWKLYFKHKEKFEFDINFILERLKNISGFLKATFSSLFSFQRNPRA